MFTAEEIKTIINNTKSKNKQSELFKILIDRVFADGFGDDKNVKRTLDTLIRLEKEPWFDVNYVLGKFIANRDASRYINKFVAKINTPFSILVYDIFMECVNDEDALRNFLRLAEGFQFSMLHHEDLENFDEDMILKILETGSLNRSSKKDIISLLEDIFMEVTSYESTIDTMGRIANCVQDDEELHEDVKRIIVKKAITFGELEDIAMFINRTEGVTTEDMLKTANGFLREWIDDYLVRHHDNGMSPSS